MIAVLGYAGPVLPLPGEGLWIWIGALLTIAIFSFLWRDNPLYRFGEHLFVGVSIGYVLVLIWTTSTYPDLVLPLFFGHEKSTHDTDISVRSGDVLRFTAENWDVEQVVTVRARKDRDREEESGTAVVNVSMPGGANRIATVGVKTFEIESDGEPSPAAGQEDGGTAATDTAGLRDDDESLRFVVEPLELNVPEGETAEFTVRLSRSPDAPLTATVARADRVPTRGRLLLLIPLALGLMLAARVVPRVAWMSRITLALLVGMGAGAAIPTVLQARVLTQAANTMSIPLIDYTAADGFDLWGTLNNLVLIVGVITSLIYFWFSIEHKGPIGVAAKTGIYFLMVGFGAAFGYTVMARVSLLIGRVLFLLKDWLQIVA